MTTKEQILSSFSHEINTIKHLYTKIPANAMDWRPLEDMRSTRELLQYLSHVGMVYADVYLKQWSSPEERREAMRARTAEAASIDIKEFPASMDKELAYITSLLYTIEDEEYRTRRVMSIAGVEVSIPEGLLEGIKTIVAYRHQLFLYARMNGAKIGTANNWRGKDPEPIVKKESVAA